MTDPLHTEPRDLLPCPFCGGDEISHGWSSPGYDGSMHTGNVECHACNAFILADTEAEAIAAWNTRTAAEAASRAREARLREALAEQVGECFDERCEMCLRHEALLASTSEGEG